MLDSLGEVLPHAARRFGDKTALVIEGRSFSFRGLDDLSSALAASPVRLGVKPADAEGILSHCREQIAAYKAPRALQFVADLPKTSTGKIMRRELRKFDV